MAFILDISDYWDRKRAALECYKSQFVDAHPGLVDRFRDHAASWGFLIGTQYGEPFASREPLGLTSMAGLV